jgi:peptidoglycan/xylan/chitin deacetylase (PgdA/CDA1 family)
VIHSRMMVREIFERAVTRLPPRRGSGDRLIINYHNVVPDDHAIEGDRSLHISRGTFASHLDVLTTRATIVPLEELVADTETTKCLAAITFDDAYEAALQYGVSLCSERRLPCTVFVAPSLLGSIPVWDRRAAASRWSEAERKLFLERDFGRDLADLPDSSAQPLCRIAVMSQLEEAADSFPNMRLGAHTMTHCNLGALDDDDALAEIHESIRWVERHFPARSIRAIAYPYGLVPSHRVRAALDAASILGLRNDGGWATKGRPFPRANIPRWNVTSGLSQNGFRIRLHGWKTV